MSVKKKIVLIGSRCRGPRRHCHGSNPQKPRLITKVATGKFVRKTSPRVVPGTGRSSKPKTYVTWARPASAESQHLNVKEGDHVKAGTVLATVENAAQPPPYCPTAATESSKTDVNSRGAADERAEANIVPGQADLEQKASTSPSAPSPSLQRESGFPNKPSTHKRPSYTCRCHAGSR